MIRKQLCVISFVILKNKELEKPNMHTVFTVMWHCSDSVCVMSQRVRSGRESSARSRGEGSAGSGEETFLILFEKILLIICIKSSFPYF